LTTGKEDITDDDKSVNVIITLKMTHAEGASTINHSPENQKRIDKIFEA
jgi:hypothetical protein